MEESKLEARCPLVKKYVDANTDREKQVLYALQHMMHEMEHPNSKFFHLIIRNYWILFKFQRISKKKILSLIALKKQRN